MRKEVSKMKKSLKQALFEQAVQYLLASMVSETEENEKSVESFTTSYNALFGVIRSQGLQDEFLKYLISKIKG